MGNANLQNAKKAQKDEFYTQYPDIQKEINAYLEYDPNVFKDKTIMLKTGVCNDIYGAPLSFICLCCGKIFRISKI